MMDLMKDMRDICYDILEDIFVKFLVMLTNLQEESEGDLELDQLQKKRKEKKDLIETLILKYLKEMLIPMKLFQSIELIVI